MSGSFKELIKTIMCGITGLIAKRNTSKKELCSSIRLMTDCLKHRGPDAEGIWIDENKKLALGHRRLSIIDLSETGRQPMISHNGRYVLVYNGEIYNYQDIASSLHNSKKQVQFKGSSDTEVLLEAISAWGVKEALSKANGMFALALWDKKEKRIILARDRFGKKPLYFGWTNNQFVFSSELKSIMNLPDFSNEISSISLSHYFKYKNVPTPHSILKGIYKLPAGSFIGFNYQELDKPVGIDGIVKKATTFWKISDCAKRPRKTDDGFSGAKQKFRNILQESVKERMISDVPLGAFLSGGVDSSLVVSIMQEFSRNPIKTFTIGFNDEDYDEASTARLIAESLGTEHTEHYIKEENAYSIVPDLASIYDEPFADASQIPTILVSQLAKKDVMVALSGDGGDELMGGYSRHLFANKLWLFNKKIPGLLKNLLPVKSINSYEYTIQNLYDKACNTGLLSKNHRQFGNKVSKAITALKANSDKELYSLLLKNKLDASKLFSNLQESDVFNYSGGNGNTMVEKMMLWDVKNYMMDDVLVKVDRATMSTSLEARSPLLDYRMFEYAWSLPLNYLVNEEDGGKLLMKSLLQDYLPKKILNKPKSGFTIPIGQWLKGPLRDWAKNLIHSNSGSYRYINKSYVINIWQKHLNGQGNWEDEIWTILMFLSWHKKYM